MQKGVHRKCSTGLKIVFWLRAWNIDLTFLSSQQIKPKKYSTRKYMWHRFWKCEISWWDSKRSECLCRSSGPKGSLKKDVVRNFAEFAWKHLSWNLFFWCFLVNFVKFLRTLFLQNSTRQLLLIIAVSIVANGVLANETLNYDTKTKAYILI